MASLTLHHDGRSNPTPPGGETSRPRVYRCLSIAGSDCGGGAGIQADLKTFAARGVFGMSAITAITIQNTTGVSGVMPVPAETIQAQIEAVLSDLGADAVKIGMLGSKEAIDAVTSSLARFYSASEAFKSSDDVDASALSLPPRALPPIVLDSVMVAKGGQPLLDESAIVHLPAILRFACLVTPNIPEAVLLLKHLDPASKQKATGQEREVTTVQHTREVAAELAECLRANYGYKGGVLVKGGHLKEMALRETSEENADDDDGEEELAAVVDVLCDGDGRLFEYASPRVHTRSTHGTGCTLSSAIAAELARGRDLERAVSKAVRYVHGAIVHAPAPDDATPATALPALPSTAALGSGHGPLDHMWKLKPLLKSLPPVRTEQAAVPDFGAELWSSIEEVFSKIIAHPFIQGLTSGDLPEDVFKFYIIQDMHYLREYSRILALLAAKADNNAGMLLFLESAKSIVGGECAMHLQFCREWGLDADNLASILEAHPASPTNMLYTSYMLRVGFDRPYYEGVAAVLPCAWIYNEVGNYLKSKGSPHPQYARWIETYGGEDFSTTTRSLINITTRVAAGLGDEQRRRMRECFVQTSKFEFMFWDMAHTKQTFPI